MNARDELSPLTEDLLAAADSEKARRLGIGGLLDVLVSRPGERPEDVLLDLRLADDRDLALALALRSGRPFEGLRDFAPDHRLFLYVPLHVAQRERIVPLVMIGDRLKIATVYLDPDLDFVRSRFPSLGIDLVLAPRGEVLEALQRVGA
ncbi:MAG: hypothetical protein ACRDM1_11615 [Gaiellaceae bacterium]